MKLLISKVTMIQKMFKDRTVKSDIIFMFLLAVGFYKIGFYKIIHFVEIVLKGAAILCLGPAVYVAFTFREYGLCPIVDVPGCALFSVGTIYMFVLCGLPCSLLWSLATYIKKLANNGKGKTNSEIILDFGGFILKRAPDAGLKFYDQKILPYSKERIKQALLAGIAAAFKANDTKTLNALESGLVNSLPHFQSGIGKEPISILSGIEDEIETNEMSLAGQWYLKRVTSDNVGFLEINYKIERNHNSELIKNVKQQIDNPDNSDN